jgi:hypothetical protein
VEAAVSALQEDGPDADGVKLMTMFVLLLFKLLTIISLILLLISIKT